MAPIRRVVLDTLKPHDPPMARFARRIADVDGVDAVTASLVEIDREVQNITLAVEGHDLDVDALEATVSDLGGSVHSIDQVACGDYVVESGTTADGSTAGMQRPP